MDAGLTIAISTFVGSVTGAVTSVILDRRRQRRGAERFGPLPATCRDCGRPLGKPHAPDCPYYQTQPIVRLVDTNRPEVR